MIVELNGVKFYQNKKGKFIPIYRLTTSHLTNIINTINRFSKNGYWVENDNGKNTKIYGDAVKEMLCLKDFEEVLQNRINKRLKKRNTKDKQITE